LISISQIVNYGVSDYIVWNTFVVLFHLNEYHQINIVIN